MDPATQPVTDAAPTRHRDHSVDALRGFAVLGLMAIHVLVFGRPMDMMGDLRAGLPYEGWNQFYIWIIAVFVQGKFMFLFAMLFGASVVYFDRKNGGQRLGESEGLWFRRMGWLAAIGLAHGLLLFFGDILLVYAICGLCGVWWLRRIRTQWLAPIAAACYLLGILVIFVMMFVTSLMMGDEGTGAGAVPENPLFQLLSEERQIEANLGSWFEASLLRGFLFLTNVMNLPFITFWLTSGIMLTGVILARNGTLTGERSARFYACLLVGGLLIGVPLSAGLFQWVVGNDFSGLSLSVWYSLFQLIGIPLSLAYMSGIMLISRTRLLRFITAPLAAVGRMALSNYLLHSLIGAFIFQGWGLGYFGSLEFPDLAWIVLIVWVINIIVSMLWLSIFRFGPMEWIWRSLTYQSLQPIRR